MLQENLLTKAQPGEEIPPKSIRNQPVLQKCTQSITANAGTRAPMMFPTNITGLSKLKLMPRIPVCALNALMTVSTRLPFLNKGSSITDLENWAGPPTLESNFMPTKPERKSTRTKTTLVRIGEQQHQMSMLTS